MAILHPGFVRTDMTNGQGFIDPRTSAEMLKTRSSLETENTGIFSMRVAKFCLGKFVSTITSPIVAKRHNSLSNLNLRTFLIRVG